MRSKTKSSKSYTDVDRLAKIKNSDIDLGDSPEITPEQFAKAVVRKGLKPVPKKTQVTLRIDSDVYEWFKETGRGFHTRINMLLRAYMEQNKSSGRNKGL